MSATTTTKVNHQRRHRRRRHHRSRTNFDDSHDNHDKLQHDIATAITVDRSNDNSSSPPSTMIVTIPVNIKTKKVRRNETRQPHDNAF